MRRGVCSLVLCLSLGVGAAGASDDDPAWKTWPQGDGDVRRGEFTVRDPACAWDRMAKPAEMARTLRHLEGVEVHRDDGVEQEVTLTERFFLVGRVQSRYVRHIGPKGHLEWRLLEGRQKRHDGFWEVTTLPSGRGAVRFENLIEAQSVLQQPLLRRIQVATMGAIVDDMKLACGE